MLPSGSNEPAELKRTASGDGPELGVVDATATGALFTVPPPGVRCAANVRTRPVGNQELPTAQPSHGPDFASAALDTAPAPATVGLGTRLHAAPSQWPMESPAVQKSPGPNAATAP